MIYFSYFSWAWGHVEYKIVLCYFHATEIILFMLLYSTSIDYKCCDIKVHACIVF